ncbi:MULTISPECIES: Bax inhibitor-1/YccA family protein [Tenacibaculum]|uniref:Bax inhibitor-1/YccA family protein n=1 Tax=Tenacibaculum TaxID=104267 RepID=UPI001F0AF9F4|nr:MULTISPECIES: Bax inhibitor-1/YccA family protein [Tenacibaculum]MCH3880895.1 Bax inhibitor-1/YccA family protein [Tenacibaculum aquimarinum]MDO6599506.1 Bax inhibitor-1/YccA family protein [Tenacibaculum sp. 1_MG-2023]
MSVFGMRTSNPAFSSYFWGKKKSYSRAKMSLSGIVFKSFLMLCLVALTASYTWKIFFEGTDIKWYTTLGAFVAIVASLFISFKHNLAKWLLPIYALAKGFFLGGISAYAHKRFPGLPLQAIAVTITTFFVMLFLFKTRLIVVTRQFRAILITASITIFTIYIISWILSFFGIHLSFIYGTSNFAIAFNVVAAIVASFSLLLDFYYIERQIGKAPKTREWLATWGFLITLIWLYVEVLRLMKKLAIRF